MRRRWEGLSDTAFRLADVLGVRVCVDGVPARRNRQNQVELMTIRRATGPFAGRLCLVGGGIGRVRNEKGRLVPESIEEALQRHFRTDLGFEVEPFTSWETPQCLAQDMRPVDDAVRPDFAPNPASRHLIASRYLVRIVNSDESPMFGRTKWGGQEASSIHWLTRNDMPSDTAFGYDHAKTLKAMFPIAESLL